MLVRLTEGPGGGVGEGGLLSSTLTPPSSLTSLGCNCRSALSTINATNSMTDTLLTVLCEENVTCSELGGARGATIVSPILLSLSGIIGQIWALYYLYTTTRPQHSRTVFFVLLSTLIWTDLVGKILTTPPALVAYSHGEWMGGVPLCNFHGFSMMLISLVTHLLVSTMAVERFIGIRHGYFYNKNITTSRTKMLLLCIWLFSVLFCALPLFGVGQYGLQYPGSWCFLNIHVDHTSPLIYRIYTNVFGVFTLINLLIMVVCNIVVITTLLCLRLCRKRCSDQHFCAPQRSYKQRELEMQMVIVLLVITLVFLVSWTPIDMRLFLNQIWPHKTQEDHIQDLIAVRLTSINQIIDPWAYIICRKVFATKAWKWMRLSLMGSRLLGRDSSRDGGSHKKGSAIRHPDKIQYKAPFKEGDDTRELNRDMVVMVEGDTLLSPHHHRHRHHHHHHRHHHHHGLLPPATTNEGGEEGVKEVEDKDGKEIFRDSGTGSNNTPSTVCSDSGAANCMMPMMPVPVMPDDGGPCSVPIPVFRSQQYRVCTPVAAALSSHLACPYTRHHHSRLKRITSSASARAASTSRYPALTHEPSEVTSETQVSCSSIPGRRHSWCCPHDASEAKQYRTQSTQTIRTSSCSHTHDLQELGEARRGAVRDANDSKAGLHTRSNELNELGALRNVNEVRIGLHTQSNDLDELGGDGGKNAYDCDPSCLHYSNRPFLLPSHAFYQQDKVGYGCANQDSSSPNYSSPNSFYSPQNSFSFRDTCNPQNRLSPRSNCSPLVSRGTCMDDGSLDQEDDSVFIVADAVTRLRNRTASESDREKNGLLSCENHVSRLRELC